MAYHSGSYTGGYAPSAPPVPDSHGSPQQHQPYPPPNYYYGAQSSYGSHGHSGFPPGTHPEVIRSFQMVDKDRSGFIDESELQQALSSGYQRFSLRTIRLLMFLFKNPNDSLRIGPKEFAALWSCLGQWRAIFERFDRDRSGKIDATELRDALYSLGYAIPPSVLQVLISRYDGGSGRKVWNDCEGEQQIPINLEFFDLPLKKSVFFCYLFERTVKFDGPGLTEKFKEKDPRYTGSAMLTYDTFMSMIIPFLVS
ncbi:hypothetical protein TEA_008329 [Camellia sinensis var. sinensis]|uniref:EF-hand domain-containing protein n=1 Tax=Camellia sinensis var. sinensis TaxID=542762 RepID=A0A4S4ETL7_CAMSN|nr:hypothetical protein TEA_008329 [Camellia sinensis var. sinensis]